MPPETTGTTDPAEITSDATFSSLSFTPVYDGQAFASAPFTQMFSTLQTRLNNLNTGAPAQGAFTYEHVSPGRGDFSSGYLLDTGDFFYEKTPEELGTGPPGTWVHSATTNNVVTEAGDALRHWACGAQGPVGKTNKPALVSSDTLNSSLSLSRQPELIDKKSRTYCGGVLVLFDGVFRKIAEHTTGQNDEESSFYTILYVLASVDGATAEWFPIPVTERYTAGVPHGLKPIWRSGKNFSFRHLLTSKSIPLNHSKTPTALSPESCVIYALRVGVGIVRGGGSPDELGVYIDSWRLSYMSMSGVTNRRVYVPDSHGNIE